jgi:hypothetical protein
MKITKDGITKTIQSSEWGKYQQQGWKKSGCSEPQPSQEGLYVIDDYTIGRLDNTEYPTLH